MDVASYEAGTEVGLGPGDIVLGGYSAPTKNGAEHPALFGPLWRSGGPFQLLLSTCYSARNARIASAVLAIAIPSVRPSVRPSHAGITHNSRTDSHRIFKLGGGVDHVTRHV